MSWIEAWFDSNLACPYDLLSLRRGNRELSCPKDHRFPIVHGIPVLLRADTPPTHHTWKTSPEDIERLSSDVYAAPSGQAVDPFVERWLVATCGLLYRHCRVPLERYPIPDIRLAAGQGQMLLDLGSNWGRWALAAARLGYRPVGIDPSLEAALAGARIARQLGLSVAYVVADARHLPFRKAVFDVTFSYSVLQHLDKAVVRQVLAEIARTSRAGGAIRIQMANVFGPRRLFNHGVETLRSLGKMAMGERSVPYPFRVRAWTPGELLANFATAFGPARLRVDGFLSLNAQTTDLDLLKPSSATVVRLSELLRRVSERLPFLSRFADSVWIEATNAGT